MEARRYPEVDACVIGIGAAGGVLVKELAEAGWSVVGLEAGPHWNSRQDFVSDERTMQKLYWREKRITAGNDPIELAGNVTGRGVGGSTVHYAMYALRMHRSDFRVRSRDGVADDWPLSYAELAPYYDQVERELGIAGPLDWPWDSPREGAYPYRPHQLNAVGELLARGCDRLGIAWRPGPIATLSAPKDERPPCVYRGWCIFGCSTDAKSSTLVTYVRKAVKAGAEIRPHSMAVRINLDPRGRARSVSYLRSDAEGNSVEEEQAARVIIVAGYAIETPRLLLLSACPGHEAGLANSSGMVGKNLMVHAAHTVYGRFPEPVRQHKAPPASTISQAFYETNRANDYVRGYSIETVGPLPIQFARMLVGSLGLWGRELREVMLDYNHFAGFGLVGEVLPQEHNRVTLHERERDRFGLPIPVVAFAWGENDRRVIKAGTAKMTELMEAAGAEATFEVADTAHLMGACRMGGDPRTSVVDHRCRTWDVPNLYICDGSVFVTSSAANPSLTIQALATRTAQLLVAAGKQGEL
jgi:choline dehydrogenase-like flavoprotein